MKSVHKITAGTAEMAEAGLRGVPRVYLSAAKMGRQALERVRNGSTFLPPLSLRKGRDKAWRAWREIQAGRMEAATAEAVRRDPVYARWFSEFENEQCL